jgi:hypothetical protein
MRRSRFPPTVAASRKTPTEESHEDHHAASAIVSLELLAGY